MTATVSAMHPRHRGTADPGRPAAEQPAAGPFKVIDVEQWADSRGEWVALTGETGQRVVLPADAVVLAAEAPQPQNRGGAAPPA